MRVYKTQKNRGKKAKKPQQIYWPFFNIFFFVEGVDEVSAHANSASSSILEDPAEVKTTKSLTYLKTNSLGCLGTGIFWGQKIQHHFHTTLRAYIILKSTK